MVTGTALSVTKSKELRRTASSALEQAKKMQVKTEKDWGLAGEFLKDVKTKEQQIKDYWSSPKKKAKAAYDDIRDKEKEMLEPMAEAEKVIKGTMSVYAEHMKKLREEQERKAREKARLEAEEKRRNDLEEERKRIEKLEKEREKARKQKDAERAAELEEERKQAEKEREELKKAPVVTEAVKVKRATPLHDGVTARTLWSAKVFDLKALVRAWLDEKVAIDIILPNTEMLDALATEYKNEMSIPGVEAVSRENIAGASRKGG